ncbi:uncharacterized protein EI90DRAFT_3131095 [Cantharellus anzutake]|uniref:uncharacterized protein n=1 Tax=Cantharellus anzutake TaxID=1750568 RepID=UPI001903AD2E|nr:uncharacterized protein EI90DRAFT_3131095 [Cantharellus anzutake]KAF8322363.1 hypothetical protein EI90DRAFT_3131095 [Cantharellus anzutake]
MALAHFQQDIILGGVPSNWSSETPETLHKVLPKSLYDQTNQRNFQLQMISMLTIREKEQPLPHDDAPQLSSIKIADRPHQSNISIEVIAGWRPELSDLPSAICRYYHERQSQRTARPRFVYTTDSEWFPQQYNGLDLWWSYRLTVPAFNQFYKAETRVIKCRPTGDYRSGAFDSVFALVHPQRNVIHKYRPAQLQLILRASSKTGAREGAECNGNNLFAYVLWYTDIPIRLSSGMFAVKKDLDHDNQWRSAIIPLNCIMLHCPLHPSIIGEPVLGTTADGALASSTQFYINPFSSSQLYQRLHL